MNTKKTLINVLILLLIGVGIWFGYSYFFQADEETGPLVSVGSGGEGGELTQESEFVILLGRLRDVKLDSAFLSNTVFSSELENYTSALPSRSQGRVNPFAAFGVGNIESGATTASEEAPTDTTPADEPSPQAAPTSGGSSSAPTPQAISDILETLGQ